MIVVSRQGLVPLLLPFLVMKEYWPIIRDVLQAAIISLFVSLFILLTSI